jgi:hypothetical protein
MRGRTRRIFTDRIGILWLYVPVSRLALRDLRHVQTRLLDRADSTSTICLALLPDNPSLPRPYHPELGSLSAIDAHVQTMHSMQGCHLQPRHVPRPGILASELLDDQGAGGTATVADRRDTLLARLQGV